MPDNTCNDYKRDLSLTDKERAEVLDWISAGAREGEAAVEEGSSHLVRTLFFVPIQW